MEVLDMEMGFTKLSIKGDGYSADADQFLALSFLLCCNKEDIRCDIYLEDVIGTTDVKLILPGFAISS